MKKLASLLCLILLIFSICINSVIPVSATETTPSTVQTVEDSQLEEEESISIEEICHAFSRLINNGKQWVKNQREQIPEEVFDILKLLRVARWIFQD